MTSTRRDTASATSTPAQCDAEQLQAIIEGHSYLYADEAGLRHGIIHVLHQAGFEPQHEYRAPATTRPNILCGSVCVEIKVQGATATVFGQLQRYVHLPEVTELLLVSAVRDHASLPNAVGGKPLIVALIGGVW